MKDEDLETIIKYLEDQFAEELAEFKFIFIFKVLNGSNFQSPGPNCYVTSTSYDGA